MYSFPGLSWQSIVGVFTVFVTDAQISRHVFNHNSADTLLMDLHPSARNILGKKNIAFLHGPEHKALRKSFLALFTRKALGVYVRKQDEIVKNHIEEWMAMGGKGEMRNYVRDLNAFTSQEVFAGPYLDNPEERETFSKSYRAMTDAFLALPLCVPGTSVLTKATARSKARMAQGIEPCCLLDFWSVKARMAQGIEPECLLDFWSVQVLKEYKEADKVLAKAAASSKAGMAPGTEPECLLDFWTVLPEAAARSKARMAPGIEPECLLDFWSVQVLKEYKEAGKVLTKAAARSKARMAQGIEPECLLDFWSVQVLKECKEADEAGEPHPEYSANDRMADSVMDFLFASQDATSSAVTWALTLMAENPDVFQKVCTGVLVGASQDASSSSATLAPTLVAENPDVFQALALMAENPDVFQKSGVHADRFSPERGEDIKFAHNFLVFGHGPHYCVGKDYAQNHIAVVLARCATSLDWTRERSSVSDNIIYLPTLYPGDSVFEFKRAKVPANDSIFEFKRAQALSKLALSFGWAIPQQANGHVCTVHAVLAFVVPLLCAV
eukprot:gene16403-22610_t